MANQPRRTKRVKREPLGAEKRAPAKRRKSQAEPERHCSARLARFRDVVGDPLALPNVGFPCIESIDRPGHCVHCGGALDLASHQSRFESNRANEAPPQPPASRAFRHCSVRLARWRELLGDLLDVPSVPLPCIESAADAGLCALCREPLDPSWLREPAKRRAQGSPSCFLCGRTDLVPAVDTDGQPYMACPSCRFVVPTEASLCVEPSGGWERGFRSLVLGGRCPYCGARVLELHADLERGLRWSCFGGCNP
jgi:DNA-directed RNA polymerase subunit RPC12/RpoP